VTFDSIEFALFLAVVVGAFALVPGRWRAGLLLIASLAFYAVWSLPMTSLILISGATDFAIGLALGRPSPSGEVDEGRDPGKSDRLRRGLLLALSLVVNLGILGYFKYKGFFMDNLHAAGLIEADSWVKVVLPPGISFYTFQTMSYSIDVYRRELEPTRSPVQFLLYVAFFPQLIAGPIERASKLLPQFAAMVGARVRAEDLAAGLRLVIFGLFKKVVLADSFAAACDPVFAHPESYGGWAALLACYCFTLQIYFDFSAYSEIAKGSARMLGVELSWNFDQPYLVTNISDFWRRWHMTLSNWFRDYVYVPLGGSRVSKSRVLFNLTATMFLSGLWHGAAWNYVLWGLFHGLLLLLHTQLRARAWVVGLRERAPKSFDFGAWFLTLHLVILGWLLFRIDEMSKGKVMLKAMGRALSGREGLPAPETLFGVGLFFAILGLGLAVRRGRLIERLDDSPALSVAVYGAAMVAGIVLAREQAPQFIYFQF